MIKKILPFVLTLFLGCSSSNDNNDDCQQPIRIHINQMLLQLVDHETGIDLLQSGTIDFDQITAIDLSNNQELEINEAIFDNSDMKCIDISLYNQGPGFFSCQIKKDNVNLFILSFEIINYSVHNCIISEGIVNFEADNYPSDENQGIYKVYL